MKFIRVPTSRPLRIAMGIALIIGGFLGFLPILGFWMIPLGVMVLSVDFHPVRRFRRLVEVRWGRNKRTIRESQTELIGLAIALIVIVRAVVAAVTPLSFDETYLPLLLGKRIVHKDLRLHPIFTLLEEEYGVPLVEADYQLEAVSATEAVADALQVKVGSPIFQIERTSMTTGNQPVDYEVLSYRGELIRFTTKLLRHPANSAGTQALRSRKR